jgi:hypothetical protein
MDKDRAKAEAEYAEQKEELTEVYRIMREGIKSFEELITYLAACIEDAKHMENLARERNNTILYSETVGIRREFIKLVKLLVKAGEEEENLENVDGTEENFREENDGNESYA